jgi:hypothetical protein
VLPLGFHGPHSWRGDYSELAFEPAENIPVAAMLAAARSALGATFEGYKGGSYEMYPGTPCWVAWYGEGAGETIGRWMLCLLLAAGRRPDADVADA